MGNRISQNYVLLIIAFLFIAIFTTSDPTGAASINTVTDLAGVGTELPNYAFQVHSPFSHGVLQLTNRETGRSPGDGGLIGYTLGDPRFRIYNMEDSPISFFINHKEKMSIDQEGNVKVLGDICTSIGNCLNQRQNLDSSVQDRTLQIGDVTIINPTHSPPTPGNVPRVAATGVLDIFPNLDGATAAIHLNEKPGVTGTKAEIVLGQGGFLRDTPSYRRFSFSYLGSDLNDAAGIFQESGGSKKPSSFVFSTGYEDTPGHFISYLPLILPGGDDVGNILLGVQAAAKVGVGTDSPREKLSVVGDSDSVNQPIMRLESRGSQSPLFLTAGDGDAYVKGDIEGNLAFGAEGFIAFETGGFGVEAEKMKLSYAGDLGIGTSQPRQRLHVNSVLMLEPTDRPGRCNGQTRGSIYFSISRNEPCFCDGNSWITFSDKLSCSLFSFIG